MIRHWWEADEWAKNQPMNFPDHSAGPWRRVIDNTDPHMIPNAHGQLVLHLHPARPSRSKVRIYV